MKTIFKYETAFEDKFRIKMPNGAEILCVQQDEKTFKPCIWAIVEKDNKLEERFFELFRTGHPIHEDMGILTIIQKNINN